MSSWSTRRQLSIISGFIVILILILAGVFLATREEPNCFDGIRNGGELGVDCGGGCLKVCESEASEPIVLWSRVFKVRDGVHDVATMIENPNPFGLEVLNYEIQVFDDKNLPVKEVRGETYLNPLERAVIFHSDVDVGFRIPERAFTEVLSISEWRRLSDEADSRKPDIRVEDKAFSLSGSPRVSATLVNNSFFESGDLNLVALLMDASGTVLAASKTSMTSISPNEKREVVFTWPEDLLGDIVSVEIIWRKNLVEGNILR